MCVVLCKLTATIIAMERLAVDVAKYMMMMMMIKCNVTQ